MFLPIPFHFQYQFCLYDVNPFLLKLREIIDIFLQSRQLFAITPCYFYSRRGLPVLRSPLEVIRCGYKDIADLSQRSEPADPDQGDRSSVTHPRHQRDAAGKNKWIRRGLCAMAEGNFSSWRDVDPGYNSTAKTTSSYLGHSLTTAQTRLKEWIANRPPQLDVTWVTQV